MSNELQARIDRMRHALGATRSESLDGLKVDCYVGPTSVYFFMDFNQGRTPTELEYSAYALIAIIASLKDHLKHWCTQHGQRFLGDQLINTNMNVALVHDLWNTDKHAAMNGPSRSGMRPTLCELRQVMTLATGTTVGSWAIFTFDPRTGLPSANTGEGGSATLMIDAQIVDEQGIVVACLQDVCARSIDSWEGALRNAGVSLA